MAREKPISPIAPISSNEDANAALAEIAEIDRAVEAANHQLNEDVDSLKKQVEEIITPLIQRKNELGGGLMNYAALHKAELFKNKKSIELPFGIIGYRKSSALSLLKGFTWKQVLGKLKELAFQDAIRVKEEPDKEIMAQWPMERLSLVGVGRTEKDDFFYETKRVEVE